MCCIKVDGFTEAYFSKRNVRSSNFSVYHYHSALFATHYGILQ